MDAAHSAHLFDLFEERQQLFFRLCTHDLVDVVFVFADGCYSREDLQVLIALAGNPDNEPRHVPITILHPLGDGEDKARTWSPTAWNLPCRAGSQRRFL